jgi:hypothetical protein
MLAPRRRRRRRRQENHQTHHLQNHHEMHRGTELLLLVSCLCVWVPLQL